MKEVNNMKALLIVDLQNDFLPGGTLAVHDGEKIIPQVNELTAKFDLIIASKDWHPVDSLHFDKWPKHCIRNTKGAEFPGNLNSEAIDHIFLTGSQPEDDGYSAFDATNTDLTAYLKEKQVNDLYVCGLATEYCVRSSVLDALRAGFTTHLVTDAIKAINQNQGDADKSIEEMKNAGAILVNTEDV